MVDQTERPPITNTETIFTDWSSYKNLSLPEKIRYTPPQEQTNLRNKIVQQMRSKNCDRSDLFILEMCLRFLEKGIMEDDFESREAERHAFLLGHTIKIKGDQQEEQEITLYELSKRVNKLSGNAISVVVTAGGLTIIIH